MITDEAMEVLRGAKLERIDLSEPLDSKNLQNLWSKGSDGLLHISVEIVTPTEAESVELALAIETLSQSEDR